MNDELRSAAQRPLSFWQTVRAVGWSFFGVRRSGGYAEDVKKLNPVHLIIAGFIAAALFIVLLLVLVNWVVGSGAAAQ